MILAGHGKDPRLVQTELPVIELPFDYDIPDNEKGNECYTPAYVLDLCRDFLEGFELDAFSNAIAQRTVRAETFWTKEDNALTKDWSRFKRKWCNPPYRKLASDGIIDKILSYIHIGETLLLVNSSTSAKWFHKCMDACTAYLHPNKRIPFYNPYSEIEYKNGKKRSGNEHDQTLFYFGDRPLEFAQALASLGNAVQPIRKSVVVEDFAIGQFVDTNHCGKNLEIVEINGVILTCRNKQGQQFGVDRKFCSHISTGLEALELSVTQPESPARSRRSDIPISAKMLKQCTVQTSLKSQSLEILEKSLHQQASISIQGDSHAREPQTQEQKQGLSIQNLLSGLNISELSTKEDPASLSSKTHLQLLITHCEQYLEDSEWSDIVGTIHKSYRQLSLEVPKNAKGSLSLPTLTSNKGVKSRSSGQSKSEKWFRDKGLLEDTQCLSPQMMAVMFGFPSEWTKCLWDVPEDQKGESDLDISLGEPSILTAPPSSSKECCTSIAVLVGTIVKPKFNGGTGKVVSSTKKKISVSWSGANNVVTYSIAEFHNQIDILSVPSPSIDEANLANSDDAIAMKPSKSVAISRMDEVLGVNASLDERLAYLQSERDRLISSGASRQGIWIEKSKPAHKPNFIQAVWKSDKPRPEWGDKKSQYIGEYGKEKHKSAIAIHQAGQQLRIVEREIKSIEKKLEKKS